MYRFYIDIAILSILKKINQESGKRACSVLKSAETEKKFVNFGPFMGLLFCGYLIMPPYSSSTLKFLPLDMVNHCVAWISPLLSTV